MMRIDGDAAKAFKNNGTSGKGMDRYKADRVRAHVEGIGEVDLYIVAYVRKSETAPSTVTTASPSVTATQPSVRPAGPKKAPVAEKVATVSAPVAAPSGGILAKLGISLEELKALKAAMAD